MAIADDLRLSYHDPQLWLRLGPRVATLYAEMAENVLTHKARDYPQYMHMMGYLEALRWVIAEARELQRKDEGNNPMSEDEC